MLSTAFRRNCVSTAKRYVSTAPQLGHFQIPPIDNEPNLAFKPGSTERAELLKALDRVKSKTEDIPLVIGGKKIYNDEVFRQPSPYEHQRTLANVSSATEKQVQDAIKACADAKRDWENAPWAERASVFLKAADLIGGKYRYDVLATTMMGQGKNAHQAEIDATCELIDFLRFNVKYADELYSQQPSRNPGGIWNRAEYRALEGFVLAITPFNFTAIAGNLSAAPAIVGNTVVWKPSNSAVLSNYLVYKIFEEAGLPDGVINFVPGDPNVVGQTAVESNDFAALHFTGSTDVFMNLYQQVANNLPKYKSYPRVVGETGGKNFHVLHPSAQVSHAAKNTVRGAFEFQGQKCSATSRVFVPESLWPQYKKELQEEIATLEVGDATTKEGFHKFSGPVIHEGSFNKLSKVIADNLQDPNLELVAGGKVDGSVGYYVSPTVFQTKDIDHNNMKTEFFGPLVTCYVYKDSDYEQILEKVDSSTKYGLTGAIFAQDRAAIELANDKLRNTAGNFYINDKCTGSVVAQQWFGGGRMSGTNDKAGSPNLLNRFVSVRSIKENFNELPSIFYPSNAKE